MANSLINCVYLYPKYDPEAEGFGFRSSATNEIVPMEYRDIITFVNQDIDTHRPTGSLDSTIMPIYTEVSSETNFEDARSIDATLAPAPPHSLYYEITHMSMIIVMFHDLILPQCSSIT